MFWTEILKDFYFAENYFSRKVLEQQVEQLLALGGDPERGFHHPALKPNRFHAQPRYPVSRYMGLGLYWDPLTYRYKDILPHSAVEPWPLPLWLVELSHHLVKQKFPAHAATWSPETALVNYYAAENRMGWHADQDEEDHQAPVIGVNYGASTRFYYEDGQRVPRSFLLPANSIYLFGDSARLMRHAVGAPHKRCVSVWGLVAGERMSVTVRKVKLAGERRSGES